jgi:Zn-dependent protease
MRGSLQIAKLFGIPVFVHWSFGLLFLFVAYIGITNDSGWQGIAFFSLLIVTLFICVILHEFGHALSARYFGVSTHDVTILPIGGVARLDRLPEKPFQEFIVAIAGPLVNVAICLILGLLIYGIYSVQIGISNLIYEEQSEDIIFKVSGTAKFLDILMRANFFLVAFNMIPAFPMDGGRVLRSLLSIRLGRTKATHIASILGQICAVGFFIFALIPLLRGVIPTGNLIGDFLESADLSFQPILALISFFIFYTARNEYQQVKLDEMLNRHTINNVLRTQFTHLKTSDSIQIPASIMTKGFETNFLVFNDEEILRGVLMDDDILDAVKHHDYDAAVMTYMKSDFVQITPYESIKDAYYLMLKSEQYILPVITEDRLVGVVDMTMVQNFMK